MRPQVLTCSRGCPIFSIKDFVANFELTKSDRNLQMRYGTQHNAIQHDDTQYNTTQHNQLNAVQHDDTQHNEKKKITKTAQLKVENSGQTTFRLSPALEQKCN